MDTEYLTRFPDGTLVRWKALNWEEYRSLVKSFGESLEGAAGWLLAEAAVALCVLDHDQDGQQVAPGDLYAGATYIVGCQIIETTGFGSTLDHVRNSLVRARERVASDWHESAMALVCAVFHLREDEIRKFSHNKFMDYCAKVELATGRPMSVVDPEQEDKEPVQQFRIDKRGRRVPVITKADLMRKRQLDMQAVPLPGED